MRVDRLVRGGGAVLAFVMAFGVLTPDAAAQWVEFNEETSARNTIPSAKFESDGEEKDYAWGDVDNDGDIDMVVVRKQPYTSAGKRVNYLFINENGVLTDRTDDFATASDVTGDQGFNTPTNDRDVVLADLNLDGWLDIITATTISDGDAKHIGHPRVYINLGCSGACAGTANWLGFRYEADRIPTMLSYTDQSGFNPRFCSVDAGDVTGDGYPDLWFGDYDSSGAGGNNQPGGADYNDRLLVNMGAANPGFFVDATNGAGSRFSGVIQIPGSSNTPFPVSAFGAAANIRDVDNDGKNDIIKQTSLNAPTYVGIAYNSGPSEGFFEDYEVVYQQAPYFVSLGDLNNDDLLDMVITDDNADRYVLNEGPDSVGVDWTSFVFGFAHIGGGSGSSSDDGFGSNSVIADLDKDGWNDVIITDIDVDIPGEARRTHIYRNLGGTVGGNVSIQEQTMGTGCQFFQGNPSTCIVASIPSNLLEGTHDIAVFDLNGDTWLDLIIGRENTTNIWMNVPNVGPAGSIEDEDGGNEQALLVDYAVDRVRLSWGASCLLEDFDYAVYRGSLNVDMSANAFDDHGQMSCSTSGAELFQYTDLGPESWYYLVAPHNGTFVGSLGSDSNGTARTLGSGAACPLTQDVGSCD